MKPTIDNLKAACSTDVDRPNIAGPFASSAWGAPCLAATDGHQALVLREAPPAGEYVVERAPDLSAVVPPLAPGVVVSAADFAAWCVIRGDGGKCGTCRGYGKHICFHEDADTGDESGCGNQHPCGDCDGAGKGEAVWKDSTVVLRRDPLTTVNAAVVRKAIGWYSGDLEVSNESPTHPILFREPGNDEWAAVVMPVRWTVFGNEADAALNKLPALLPPVSP